MTEEEFGHTHPNSTDSIQPRLQLVAWEITRSCNLFCAHCRASAAYGPYQNELTTAECLRIIDEILEVGRPVLILTGGEPLLRPDVFTVAKYASSKGLRVVMGSNGTLISKLEHSIKIDTAITQLNKRGNEFIKCINSAA